MQKYRSKAQDYETTIVQLLDIYAAGLKGRKYQAVIESTREFYKSSNNFFAYVKPTLKVLWSTHDVAIITGEPQTVAQAVAELFGIKFYCSSQYEMAHNGVFTGRVESYLASRHEKQDAAYLLIKKYGKAGSYAFGDSESDIEMLRAVENAVCVNPTQGLKLVAQRADWRVMNDSQKTTALPVV